MTKVHYNTVLSSTKIIYSASSAAPGPRSRARVLQIEYIEGESRRLEAENRSLKDSSGRSPSFFFVVSGIFRVFMATVWSVLLALIWLVLQLASSASQDKLHAIEANKCLACITRPWRVICIFFSYLVSHVLELPDLSVPVELK